MPLPLLSDVRHVMQVIAGRLTLVLGKLMLRDRDDHKVARQDGSVPDERATSPFAPYTVDLARDRLHDESEVQFGRS